jgi:hypothetical protein
MPDYPFDPDADYPDDDGDDEEDEGELTDEDIEQALAYAAEEEPDLASELEIVRQYPTFVRVIARVVECPAWTCH